MQPSLTIFTPAYSAPVPIPEIGRVVTGRASSIKKYIGVHGWAYCHSCLCACCRPASGYIVRGVNE